MSRIGRAPIAIPAGVEVVVDGSTVTVKGAKGTLTRTMNSNITITKDGDTITVTRPNDQKENRSLHGLTRTLIANMIEGVANGYKKELEINGIGYRAEVKGKDLVMKIGFSHDVIMTAPEGVTVECPSANKVIVVVPTSRSLVSLRQKFVKRDLPNLIRARALSMLTNTSAVKKVKPVRVNKIGKGVIFQWLVNKTAIKQEREDRREYVLRSAVLQLVLV